MDFRIFIASFTAACLALSGMAFGAAPAAAAEDALVFTAVSGEKVDAFSGVFSVPENRANPKSRMIDVHYVRFPATGKHAGAPIVYLSGGPGGSGIETAKHERFALFMAMREFGDVIALDQRGTGQSATAPTCVSNVTLPYDRLIAEDARSALLRQAAEYCGTAWRSAGFDPAGYTTVESARDLDALRVHLGAKKISLWGISYGTHLALAAVKEMGPHIDRIVLASVEGLDQTVKLPAETDAYFARVQAAIDQEPAAKAAYPDIAALMRRVHARLDAQPIMIHVATETGPKDMLLTRDVMQTVASAVNADPQGVARLLALYLAVDAGNTEPLAGLLGRFYTPGAPEEFELMPLAMDVASGISAKRLALVEKQAKTALLGDMLNYPMPQLNGALGLDLGEGFRAASNSAIPTLVLTGTLDGRTYPNEQKVAVAGMSNLTAVTVENAGHNLFMVSPEVTEVIREFMSGQAPHTKWIKAPMVLFAPKT